MLRLTHSFCRYLKVTCETYSYTHVRKFTHIICKRKTCLETVQSPAFITPILHNNHQFRLLANIKKRVRLKKSTQSNDTKKLKQMSETVPTSNHVTYGTGSFDISSVDNKPQPEDWNDNDMEDFDSPSSSKDWTSVPPDFRVWEPLVKRSEGNSNRFKVVSYNVLAQYLLECHPYLYTECTPRNLKWKVRAARLYDEITQLAPDILCLQEVQVSHLNSFYSKFEQRGYFGIFKQKTGHRQDGCAIYFKQALFELEDHITVEYYQPELPILNRDNIGVMVKLRPRFCPRTPIVVATTHLLYNPKRTDVRLAQLQVLLAEIDRFAYYNNGRESGHLPIILTGDFNSTPDSAVVKLLDRGHVSASPFRGSSDWTRIGVTDNCQHLSVILNRKQGRSTDFNALKLYNSDYSTSPQDSVYTDAEDDHLELFNGGLLGHSLRLKSTYNKYKSDGQYEATTFQDYWVTVDYIYFSACSTMKLIERLRLPTASECDVLGKLPNEVYASDHIALGAVFELRASKSML